tara:strand:- start:165 stop:545 length:381 start_codon:yes stop_codon:yes gene_type:complete
MTNKYFKNFNQLKELHETKLNRDKKLIEVKLSKLDDIEEAINRGLGLYEFVEEAVDKATSEFIKAKDIVRFDMNDAYGEAEDLLNTLIKDINALGIDVPDEVQNLQRQLDQLEKEIDDADSLIKNF